MVEKQKTPADEEDPHKDDSEECSDEHPQEATCGTKCGMCVVTTVKCIYKGILALFMTLCECLGICWYPTKERMLECCASCGRKYNPELDPAYACDEF